MKLFFYLLLFITLQTSLFSQPWMDELSPQEQNNFYKIQNAFYEYWEGKDMTQYKGWKQFKRWEWFWEDRVNEDGSFPPTMHYWNEINRSKRKKDIKTNSTGWQFMGPVEARGGYNGLGRINCVVVNPSNANEIWAGAASGGIWKSTDGGNSWSSNTDNFDALGITDICFHPSNSNIMFVATGDRDGTDTYSAGVLKSTNGGSTWNTTGLSYNIESTRALIYRLLIDPNNGDRLYAATNNGIYRSTDGADSWSKVDNGTYKDMEFAPDDSDIIYASGRSIVKTANGGDNWFALSTGLPSVNVNRIAIAVTEDDANRVYALYSNGGGLYGIYRSDDKGQSWTQEADNDPNYLHWDQNPVNESGGQGWYDLCIAASPDDADEVFIGGINIWKSDDGGASWEISSFWYNIQNVAEVHADQHDLWYDHTGKLWCGNDGGVYNTTNSGDTWNWLGDGLEITQFYRLGISQLDSDFLIGGTQDNGTKLVNDGNWWDRIGGDGFESIIAHDNDNIVYGSLYYGDIFRSTNGGNNFARINSSNGQDYDDITESGDWLTPYILDPSDADIMYIGMNNVWKSTDAGDTFVKQTINGSGRVKALAVAPSNQNIVYAGYRTQLYRSTDAGDSWTQVSKPGSQNLTYLAVASNDPNRIYLTQSGFSSSNKVFESTDGGDNWTNISSGLPNFPVNCVYYADESNNRIYIGNDIGVYYRDDNTPGWVEFTDDLPNVVITELELNNSAGRLYASSYGRGIWYIDLDISLATPSLNSPSNDSRAVQSGNLDLSWNSVTNATKYHLQIATDPSFSNIIFNNNNVTSTEVLVPSLDYYTDYFWRVSALAGASQSDWSDTWMFRTKLATPKTISPENDEEGLDLTVNLSWSQVNGAENYTLQVSTDNAFNDILVDELVTSNMYELTELDNFTDYYWKVKASDSDGSSNWSAGTKFSTIIDYPILTSPSDSSMRIDPIQTFQWNEVEGADQYIIQFSHQSDFSVIYYYVDNIQTTSIEIDNLKNGQEYYWRVRAIRNGNNGDWSDSFYFSTGLEIPVLLVPENGASGLENTLVLNWQAYTYAENYHLQVSSDSLFNEMVVEKSDLTSGFHELVDLEKNSTYFWRIKVITSDSESDWSETFNFTTALPIVILSTPLNESTQQELDGTLIWESADNIESYDLELSENSNFSNAIVSLNLTETQYAYSGLDKSKNYYWRVRTVSGDNKADWSDTFVFTTIVDRPVLKDPNDGDTLRTQSVTLNWNALDGTERYLIQVSEEDQFTASLTDETNIINNSFNQSGLAFERQYFWRVAAVINGQTSDWSDVWSFYIFEEEEEEVTIGIPVLSSPQNASEGNETDIILSWESVENATSYNVELTDSENFPEGSSIMEEKTNQLQASYSGLENDKSYWWRVNAENSEVLGEWSEPWFFKTKETTSIDELDLGNVSFKISPVPTNGLLYVNYNSKISNEFDISIYNIEGEKQIENTYMITGNSVISLNVSELNAGVYFIRFISENKQGQLKFIKE